MELNNTLRLACPFGGVSGEAVARSSRKLCDFIALSIPAMPRFRVQCFVCLLAAFGEYGLTRTREEKLC